MPPRTALFRSRIWALSTALAVWALALGVALLDNRPPTPRSSDAPTASFSAARAADTLDHLMGDGLPHPIGSPANARVRQRIVERLRELGYRPEIQETFVCSDLRSFCGTVHNVVTRIDGKRPGEAILLASHYDTVPASPGAADPMAGVASLLEVARILGNAPTPVRSVILLWVDGEEAGLLGSTAFVESHPWAAEVQAVVNLEARGSSGPSVVAYTSNGDLPLIQRLAAAAPHPEGSGAITALAGLLPNATDQRIYRRLGAPAIDFGFAGSMRSYHSGRDTLAALDRGSLQHHGENLLAMARSLAWDGRADAGRDAVFFSAGPWMLWWPAWLSPILAAVALLTVGAATGRSITRGALRAGQLLWGMAGLLLALLGGTLAGFALDRIRAEVVPIPSDWVAHPEPTVFALWAAVFGGVTLPLAAVARRAGHRGLASGAWLVWSAGALAAALLLPTVSYLLILPALTAGAVLLALDRRRADRAGEAGRLFVASLAGAGVALLLFVPSLWFLKVLVGLAALPVVALLTAIPLTAMGPLLVPLNRRWLPGAVALGLAGILLVPASLTPTFTVESPQWLSLLYILDGETGEARWLSTGSPLPDELKRAADFGWDGRPLPWSTQEIGPTAPAPALALAEPALEIDRVERGQGGKRIVHGRLRSPRGAPVLHLVVPPSGDLGAVRLGGVEVPDDRMGYRRYARGYRVITCWTVPAEGVPVELVLDGPEPVELTLVDRSFDLPDEGAPLLAARPPTATPAGNGDSTVVLTRLRL